MITQRHTLTVICDKCGKTESTTKDHVMLQDPPGEISTHNILITEAGGYAFKWHGNLCSECLINQIREVLPDSTPKT